MNGVELWYERHGAGLPLLFIHGGYGGAGSTLGPATEEVIVSILPPERVQTIVYDRRNAGRSQYVLAPFTLADLVADAAALLDYLGHRRAVIVGSSAGGPIAMLFALTHPERTIGLALPNTGADLLSEERQVGRERRALIERLEREGAEAVFAGRREALREQAGAAQGAVSDDDLRRYSTGEIYNFAAYRGYDLTGRLSELAELAERGLPVCVIHGTADETVPFAWGEALHRAIPGSEFHTIEGGGHGILRWQTRGRRCGSGCLESWTGRGLASAADGMVVARGSKGSGRLQAHAVRSATVGGIRDARMAGIRPASAPIRMAEAMPPNHASTGITICQLLELA